MSPSLGDEAWEAIVLAGDAADALRKARNDLAIAKAAVEEATARHLKASRRAWLLATQYDRLMERVRA